MNVFYLSASAVESAKFQCDVHVRKMVTESGQMLSTAHRLLDENASDELYKVTHHNHPWNVWTRASRENYVWHYAHWYSLCREYERRAGRVHATYERLKDLVRFIPSNMISIGTTPVPKCVADEFKDLDPINAYREFYISKQHTFKRNKMEWTNRETPAWFRKEVT